MAQEARLDSRYTAQQQRLELGGEDVDEDDEPDSIDGGYLEKKLPFKVSNYFDSVTR